MYEDKVQGRLKGARNLESDRNAAAGDSVDDDVTVHTIGKSFTEATSRFGAV